MAYFSFLVFWSQKNCNLHHANVENNPSSIWCWDSNLRTREYVSPTITTRPASRPEYAISYLDSKYKIAIFLVSKALVWKQANTYKR